MARIGIRKPLEGILTHLQSLDVLNFAAIYNGQFDMLDGSEMYSFPMPCAFIEVLNPAASLPLLGGFIQKILFSACILELIFTTTPMA